MANGELMMVKQWLWLVNGYVHDGEPMVDGESMVDEIRMVDAN